MDRDPDTVEDVLALLGDIAPASRLATGTLRDAGADVSLVELYDGRTGRLPASETAHARKSENGSQLILAEIEDGSRPLLSATRTELLPLLLEGLVPELRDGTVRVMRVARRVGIRSKVAVAATTEDVDPVGAVLGRGAGRIRLATRLLDGERIDVVAWHPDKARFAVNALAVSAISSEMSEDGTIRVVVPGHQLSAAIGGGKLNVTLASQLVRTRINLEGA